MYFLDKIYEARNEILKLTTPVVAADIPETYFAPKDHDFEQAYCKNLASLLSNYPESPITPNMQLPSGFGSPYSQIQQKYAAPNIPRLQQHNDRFRIQQQQQQQNQSNFLSPFHHIGNTNAGNDIQNTNISPRNNSSTNTSGYHSYSSSTTSLEQLYPPYQMANAAAAAVAAAAVSGLQHHQLQQQLHQQQQLQQQQHNHNKHNLSATTDYTSPNSSNYLDGSNRRLSSSTSSLINDIDIRSPCYDMTVIILFV